MFKRLVPTGRFFIRQFIATWMDLQKDNETRAIEFFHQTARGWSSDAFLNDFKNDLFFFIEFAFCD